MARSEKSVFDYLESNVETSSVNSELAATANQQQLMLKQGELQEVHYIGPNGTYIPGFYSAEEKAFLPQFKVD